MTQPTEAESKIVDKLGNFQLADRQAAITTVTMTAITGADGTYSANEQTMLNAIIVDLAAVKVAQDLIISALEAHGLLADN